MKYRENAFKYKLFKRDDILKLIISINVLIKINQLKPVYLKNKILDR